jgi:ABC-2 type transport system permease protein
VAILRKVWAFVRRDLLNMASYRTNFVFSMIGILFSSLTFFFFSRLIEGQSIQALAPYGGKYFPYALIGIAFYQFLGAGLGSLSESISRAQTTGTLEALLVTPTSLTTIIFSSTIFAFFFAALRVVVYLIFGAIFLDVDLSHANVPMALFVLGLSTINFVAIGMLSAAWVMVFKGGSPTGFVFGSVSALMGGVLFPPSVLFSWMRPLSVIFPITHALEAMRGAVLMGEGLSELWPSILALLVFAAILLPAGVAAFSLAVRRAKRTGSLVQY